MFDDSTPHRAAPVMAPILPLTLQDVVLRFGGDTVLDGVSLNLGGTGCTVVMGPNGAGKACCSNCYTACCPPRQDAFFGEIRCRPK